MNQLSTSTELAAVGEDCLFNLQYLRLFEIHHYEVQYAPYMHHFFHVLCRYAKQMTCMLKTNFEPIQIAMLPVQIVFLLELSP